MNDFYIILSSNAAKSQYPQNNWHHFTNVLVNPLDLQNYHEVALVGLYIVGKDVPSRFVSVNSNIVSSYQSGDSMTNSLNIVSLTNPLPYISNLLYVPCLTSQFNHINIEFVGLKPIVFKQESDIEVQVRLHFKRKM